MRIHDAHVHMLREDANSILQKDFSEFNVCQSQLRGLYGKGIAAPNQSEFVAYGILYDILNLDFSRIFLVQVITFS